jgi:hypothetical protein
LDLDVFEQPVSSDFLSNMLEGSRSHGGSVLPASRSTEYH